MRLVLDTNVVVTALRSPTGASAEIVRRVLYGELAASVSTALLIEYEAVATRTEHLQASGLTRAQVLEVLDALAVTMDSVAIEWRLRPVSPDPGDDLIVEAAFNAGATIVVTGNTRDLEKPCADLGIRTVRPSVLLSELTR
jgi:putative PIN family toxin of toxin-antitoxin system